jgi:uncharacterized RDD family membrane protein YckC
MNGSTAIRLAPLGRRLAALTLDGLGVVLAGWFFAAPIYWVEDALGMVKFLSIDTSAEAVMTILLSLWGAAWIYAISDIAFAATPGKALLGLTIARRNGTKAPLGRLIGRYFAKNAFLLILLPFGIVDNLTAGLAFLAVGLTIFLGYFLVLGRGRRTLHERISGTVLMRRRDLIAAPW